MEMIGKVNVNFENRSGQKVEGISLHCISSMPADLGGRSVEKIFIPKSNPFVYESAQKLPIDVEISVQYNRYGNVVSVDVVPSDAVKK